MGVLIVFHHVANQPHTSSPHFARFPYRLPAYLLTGSIFYLHLRRIMNPPFHPQSVCPSANLTFISPTSYRNSPMGPPPFISFPRKFCPPWGTHFTLGHPFLYLYIFPQNYSLFIVQTPLFPVIPFSFVVTVGDLFPFGHTQPMSPLVGALLIIYPCRHRPYLQSTPQVTYLYPLNLFTLSHLWHNLSPVLSSP
jgi:hypothetical protein